MAVHGLYHPEEERKAEIWNRVGGSRKGRSHGKGGKLFEGEGWEKRTGRIT